MTDVRDRIATLAKSYEGDNLLNVMASLERASGGTSVFNGANALDENALAEEQHIVLLLLDGMGHHLLHRYGREDGVLRQRQIATLNTVFPTTTSAAISALMTGHPPGQHGVLAWHMHLTSGIFTTLLWQHREASHQPKPKESKLYAASPVFSRIQRDAYQVQPRYLVESPFSLRHRGRAKALPASNFNELLGQINHITQSPKKTFSYAYWPELDSIGHKHGVASSEWRQALHSVERGIEQLQSRLAGRPVTLVVTADHGMVDAHGGKCESLTDAPDLAAYLEAPVAGEPRAAFCAVDPDRLAEFDALCSERYADRVAVLPVSDAFDCGLFGPEPNNALQSRAGNRILLMQDKRTLVEVLPGEQLPAMVGVHGGLHQDEIDVPLIVIKPD